MPPVQFGLMALSGLALSLARRTSTAADTWQFYLSSWLLHYFAVVLLTGAVLAAIVWARRWLALPGQASGPLGEDREQRLVAVSTSLAVLIGSLFVLTLGKALGVGNVITG